jgi:hypothetical protein
MLLHLALVLHPVMSCQVSGLEVAGEVDLEEVEDLRPLLFDCWDSV